MSERDILAGQFGHRVSCRGNFSHSNFAPGSSSNKTSLLQNVEVEIDGERHWIGHVWVQHADELWAARPTHGTTVTFTARVTKYTKWLDTPNAVGLMTETRFGLDRPHEVVVDQRLPDPPHQPQPVAPCDYFGVMKDVKALAVAVTLDALRVALPHLDEITRLAKQLGSKERLLDIAELLA